MTIDEDNLPHRHNLPDLINEKKRTIKIIIFCSHGILPNSTIGSINESNDKKNHFTNEQLINITKKRKNPNCENDLILPSVIDQPARNVVEPAINTAEATRGRPFLI